MGFDDSGLDLEDDEAENRKPGTALERIRQVSQSLSDAARRSRMSARARNAYSGGGFQARRGAKAARWALVLSFVLLVLTPGLASAVYYGFIASNQYVSEAEFTVTGGEAPAPDGLGLLSGIPSLAIVQDTQVVVNYVHSRAAVEALDKSAALLSVYSTSKADWLSRFDAKKPIEKFVKYWERMSDISIKMPAGIVDLKVRAFNAEDARRVTQASLDLCEGLINEMNDRINGDAVTNAEQELQRTSQRLAKALAALEKLSDETRAALLKMQGEYATQLKYVTEAAPQMRELKSRIDATQAQIAEIESKLTSERASTNDETTVSGAMTTFGELDLERQISERLYAGAAASLELARFAAERKMMYLKAFVSPVAAEEPQYPKRALYPALIFVGCLAGWGLLCALAVTVRNHMA